MGKECRVKLGASVGAQGVSGCRETVLIDVAMWLCAFCASRSSSLGARCLCKGGWSGSDCSLWAGGMVGMHGGGDDDGGDGASGMGSMRPFAPLGKPSTVKSRGGSSGGSSGASGGGARSAPLTWGPVAVVAVRTVPYVRGILVVAMHNLASNGSLFGPLRAALSLFLYFFFFLFLAALALFVSAQVAAVAVLLAARRWVLNARGGPRGGRHDAVLAGLKAKAAGGHAEGYSGKGGASLSSSGFYRQPTTPGGSGGGIGGGRDGGSGPEDVELTEQSASLLVGGDVRGGGRFDDDGFKDCDDVFTGVF